MRNTRAVMTPGIFTLFTITFSLSRGLTVRPNILNAVSNATCLPEYGWMNNTEQKDPCLTVAYVIGACVGDTWTQPALPSGYSYNSPNGTTATPCYCSWSCYNLMMACTLCQDPAYTNEITTWPSFSQNCPSNYKDAIFPEGYVIPNNISIPYWATIDPTSWPNELFNIGQAENYSQQNYPDYRPSDSSSSGSSTNLGAIIGGTVGGVIGLLLILIGSYVLYKRRQSRRLDNTNGVTPMATHTRWPSSSVFPPSLTGLSPTSHTTASSSGPEVTTLLPTSYSPFHVASPRPPTETTSFLTSGNTVVQRTRAIPMV